MRHGRYQQRRVIIGFVRNATDYILQVHSLRTFCEELPARNREDRHPLPRAFVKARIKESKVLSAGSEFFGGTKRNNKKISFIAACIIVWLTSQNRVASFEDRVKNSDENRPLNNKIAFNRSRYIYRRETSRPFSCIKNLPFFFPRSSFASGYKRTVVRKSAGRARKKSRLRYLWQSN